jgi:hypothetical protein
MLGGGSRPGERIERLLARAIYSAHDRLFGGFLAAVLLAFACASSLAPHWIAFAQEARPSFDIASVKSNKMPPRQASFE